MPTPHDRAHDDRRQAGYEKLIGKVAYDIKYPKQEEGPDRNKEKEWTLTMADENQVHESKVRESGKHPMDDAPRHMTSLTPETMNEMSDHYSKGTK